MLVLKPKLLYKLLLTIVIYLIVFAWTNSMPVLICTFVICDDRLRLVLLFLQCYE